MIGRRFKSFLTAVSFPSLYVKYGRLVKEQQAKEDWLE